jgi:K+-sensing histidine kinase KdpD
MGLGLSICYRIIQQCGGQITVKSEPGTFAEFTLELPTFHDTTPAAVSDAAPAQPKALHATAI